MPKRPSARSSRTSAGRSLSDQLIDQIEDAGLTAYALGKLSGVDHCTLGKWMRGERGITLDSADRVAEALGGFRLIPARTRSRAPAPARIRRAQRETPEAGPDADDGGSEPMDSG